MSGANYSKRRRIIQGLSVLMLMSVPLRLVCFDLEKECFRFFGKEIALLEMFFPLFLVVGLLMFVFYLSMKKGRLFCSHMCPMHLFLETVNSPKNRESEHRSKKVWIWGILWSFLLTQVILSGFQPLTVQLRLIAAGHLPLIGLSAALFLGFLGLFVLYQETFCKKGCPYALIQQLFASNQTRRMEFSNPEKTCTNCRRCDAVCPFNLRPRFESKDHECTNCNLCAEACTSELGEGNTLFHLVNPEMKKPIAD